MTTSRATTVGSAAAGTAPAPTAPPRSGADVSNTTTRVPIHPPMYRRTWR